MPTPLQVAAIPDERMCFYVHSEANPKAVYRVDLLAYSGNGECHCVDFRTRRWPVVRDGGRATCKHIDRARTVFLDDLLQHMAKQETQR